MLEAILIPALAVTGIGLICAAVLVAAAKFMSLKKRYANVCPAPTAAPADIPAATDTQRRSQAIRM